MSVGLDAFGFADLTRCVLYHVALTSCLGDNDELKFNMGTWQNVQQTLERCWEVAPSSSRIVQDFLRLDHVLTKIVENKGVALLDEFYRSGRREQSMKGDRQLKGRSRTHARKASMVASEVHPSVAEVRNLYKPEPHLIEEAAEAYEHRNERGQPLDEVFIAS